MKLPSSAHALDAAGTAYLCFSDRLRRASDARRWPVNPKGILPSSQGCAECATLGKLKKIGSTRNGLRPACFRGATPLELSPFGAALPRVAPAAPEQPWALGRNPVGILAVWRMQMHPTGSANKWLQAMPGYAVLFVLAPGRGLPEPIR